MKKSSKRQLKNKKKKTEPEVFFYLKLINKIRRSKDNDEINEAFTSIVKGLEVKIKKICSNYRIPGHDFDDIYSESLYALRFKAIKDYDQDRGSGEGLADFGRFAMLCIRRHLATTLKTAHQNKKKILNGCKSLDQDRSSENEELSLINILPSINGDIGEEIQQSEEFKSLINKLLKKMSPFEKNVFFLYAKQYTYDEIADIINKKFPQKDIIDMKAIDNSLMRLKQKAKQIMKTYAEEEGKVEKKNVKIKKF